MANRSGGESLDPDVDFILTNAPRLMKVAGATAISFALWDGVNRALLESDNNTDRREIASGYRGDCAFTAVTRLFLLLDRNPNQVSFQTVYTRLQSGAVVTLLLTSLDEGSFWTPAILNTSSILFNVFCRPTARWIGRICTADSSILEIAGSRI
jgi:hypothetical protein